MCGAANNQLADASAEAVLTERGILFVPDFIASAGAAIQGIATSVMSIADPTPLIDALGRTARSVLDQARAERRSTVAVASGMARARIEAARAAKQNIGA